MINYEMFNEDALSNTIKGVINYMKFYSEKILAIQYDLRQIEMSTFWIIFDIFAEAPKYL